jgi:hypothetical protein
MDRVHLQQVELGTAQAGLLTHLTPRGLVRGFVEINETTRQHVLVLARLDAAAREQNLPSHSTATQTLPCGSFQYS